jgi:hypothetical protein
MLGARVQRPRGTVVRSDKGSHTVAQVQGPQMRLSAGVVTKYSPGRTTAELAHQAHCVILLTYLSA